MWCLESWVLHFLSSKRLLLRPQDPATLAGTQCSVQRGGPVSRVLQRKGKRTLPPESGVLGGRHHKGVPRSGGGGVLPERREKRRRPEFEKQTSAFPLPSLSPSRSPSVSFSFSPSGSLRVSSLLSTLYPSSGSAAPAPPRVVRGCLPRVCRTELGDLGTGDSFGLEKRKAKKPRPLNKQGFVTAAL